MKDASNWILTELYTLLNGLLTYNSVTVPIYAIAESPLDSANLFVNFSSGYITTEIGTKDSFIRPYTVVVDVVSRKQDASLSEREVNFVSNQISSLLKISPAVLGINGDSEFKVISIDLQDVRSFNDRLEDLYHIRKVLNINFTIKQL